jgi:hypothetical protein
MEDFILYIVGDMLVPEERKQQIDVNRTRESLRSRPPTCRYLMSATEVLSACLDFHAPACHHAWSRMLISAYMFCNSNKACLMADAPLCSVVSAAATIPVKTSRY